MWEKIKGYKEVITLVLVTISVFLWVGGTRTMAEKALKANDEIKKTSEKQQTSIDLLTQLVAKHEGTLEGTLTMWGIDPDKAKAWAALPQEPVVDTLGNPILNTPWVKYEEGIKVGLKYRFDKDDSGKVIILFVDTLWDLRARKK